jgi:hypothetical protein
MGRGGDERYLELGIRNLDLGIHKYISLNY